MIYLQAATDTKHGNQRYDSYVDHCVRENQYLFAHKFGQICVHKTSKIQVDGAAISSTTCITRLSVAGSKRAEGGRMFSLFCAHTFRQNDVIVCFSAVTTTRLGDGCVRCTVKINVDLPKKSMMVAIEMFARVVCVLEFRNGLTQGYLAEGEVVEWMANMLILHTKLPKSTFIFLGRIFS